MTQKAGKARKSTYQMAEKRHWQGTMYLVLALGAVVVIYLLITNSKPLGLSGGAFLVLLILMRVIPDFAERKPKKKLKVCWMTSAKATGYCTMSKARTAISTTWSSVRKAVSSSWKPKRWELGHPGEWQAAGQRT